MEDGIKTDVIEGKAGDKYTLTFDDGNEEHIVIKLVINYEEVELTDEIINGSYTGTFSGAVVVTAEFGTVSEYGEQLIEDYCNAYAKKDTQMSMLLNGSVSDRQATDDDKATYVKDWVKGSYYDNKVATEAKKYVDKISSTLNALKKDHTIKDEIDALSTLAKEAKEKIDAKYKEVFAEAKTKASKAIDTLYKGSSTKSMTASDIANMVTLAKADLEKATTLAEIGKVIDSTGTGKKVGTYDEIERMRKLAFDDIDASIKAVYDKDPSLNPGSTAAEKESYAAFLAQLEEFGISEDSLPTKIYENYKAKISAATSFEYTLNSDGTPYLYKSTLQKEATDAISTANSNILKTVRQAVLDSYYKEIDSSTSLTTEQSKVTCKGAVETAISEWFDSHSKTGASYKATVTNFISSDPLDGSTTALDVAKNGGILYIENVLDKNYVSFQTERLNSKKNTIKSEINAAAAEIIDSDSLYKTILSTTEFGEDEEYENEADFADALGVKKDSVEELQKFEAPSTNGTTLAAGTVNLLKYYVSLTTDTSGVKKSSGNNGGFIGKASITKVSELLSYKKSLLGNLKTVYDNAVTEFWSKETEDLAGNLNVDEVFASSALSTALASLITEGSSITELHEKLVASNSENWVGLADSLSQAYLDWWDAVAASTTTFVGMPATSYVGYGCDSFDVYGKLPLSDVYSRVKTALNSIVSGDIKSYDDIKEVIGELDDKYDSTIAAYAAEQMKALGAVKDSLVNASTNSGVKRQEILKAYDNWVAVANAGLFSFDSYTSVDNWFERACADLSVVQSTGDGDAETDFAHKLQTKILETLSYVLDYEDVVAYDGTKVLSEEQKGYYDVSKLFSSMYYQVYSCLVNTYVTSSNYVSVLEQIIKVSGGEYVVETSEYNESAISNAVDLGKARKDAYDALETVYNSLNNTSGVTEGYKACLLANYKIQVSLVTKAASTTGMDALIEEASPEFAGTKVAGYKGTAVDALSTNGVSFTESGNIYTDYVETVNEAAAAYQAKAWLENPEKSATIREVSWTNLTSEKTYDELYEALENYKAEIDAIVNA